MKTREMLTTILTHGMTQWFNNKLLQPPDYPTQFNTWKPAIQASIKSARALSLNTMERIDGHSCYLVPPPKDPPCPESHKTFTHVKTETAETDGDAGKPLHSCAQSPTTSPIYYNTREPTCIQQQRQQMGHGCRPKQRKLRLRPGTLVELI
jgi:hypothetical protein